MQGKPTVFVVDDDSVAREATRSVVEAEGIHCESYDSAAAFLAEFDPRRNGCLLLDVRMPGISGIELQRQLLDKGIDMPVIMLTGFADIPTAVDAMKLGAVEFIEKPFQRANLVQHIHRALECDQQRHDKRAQRVTIADRVAQLSPREREVMAQVVSGLANKQIAANLGVSPKTVEIHRANVMKKMCADSLADLVRMAGGATKDAPTDSPASYA